VNNDLFLIFLNIYLFVSHTRASK